jgi:hypothetical protein
MPKLKIDLIAENLISIYPVLYKTLQGKLLLLSEEELEQLSIATLQVKEILITILARE